MSRARRVDLEWEVGWTADPERDPERWVPATVPGAVQLDWARAEGWPPYWQGDEYRRYRWMEDVHWVYRARIPESTEGGEGTWLVAEGADPEGWLTVDDGDPVRLGRWATGTAYLGRSDEASGAEVRVHFHPLGVEEDVQRTRGWGRYWKSAVQFGWDFCPRLIPIGLCAPAYLHRGPVRLAPEIETAYDPETGVGRVTVATWGAASVQGYGTRITLTEPGGRTWTDGDESGGRPLHTLEADAVRAWSPEHPFRYQLVVEAFDPTSGEVLDVWQSPIGFRRAELVHHDGAWSIWPPVKGSETPPPFTLRLNGRDRFVHGTNWVPPMIFPGEVDADVLRPLLEAAKHHHFDLLRVWGGGGPMPPAFYDLCDELGLMVWQEFPLACARYEASPAYMERLADEAPAIVETLRWRPSLVLWSGGNELFCPWSRMTPQDPPMRELASICWTHDPRTPYIPTSPIYGVQHGDYRFVDYLDVEAHGAFAATRATAYAEYGIPAPSPRAVLESFMAPDELWPPREGTAWETHFWIRAWDGDPESWGMASQIRRYFGDSPDLDHLVEAGQLLQAEGLKQLYEEARRQGPRCGMALNWCFNEPWPCAANNSLVAWPRVPKPALAAVGESLRPQIVSAAVRRFTWAPGEAMDVELWVLNSGPEDTPAIRVEAWLEAAGGARSESAQWLADPTAPLRPQRGSVHRLTVPDSPDGRFRLHVAALDRPGMDSVYTFLHPLPAGEGAG